MPASDLEGTLRRGRIPAAEASAVVAALKAVEHQELARR